jgi:uncharacterized Zn finger protein (UPF0148 family)
VITGWLAPEDCPDCGGPLLDTSTSGQVLTLECPGCGYRARWHATDHNHPSTDDSAEPGEQETE